MERQSRHWHDWLPLTGSDLIPPTWPDEIQQQSERIMAASATAIAQREHNERERVRQQQILDAAALQAHIQRNTPLSGLSPYVGNLPDPLPDRLPGTDDYYPSALNIETGESGMEALRRSFGLDPDLVSNDTAHVNRPVTPIPSTEEYIEDVPIRDVDSSVMDAIYWLEGGVIPPYPIPDSVRQMVSRLARLGTRSQPATVTAGTVDKLLTRAIRTAYEAGFDHGNMAASMNPPESDTAQVSDEGDRSMLQDIAIGALEAFDDALFDDALWTLTPRPDMPLIPTDDITSHHLQSYQHGELGLRADHYAGQPGSSGVPHQP